MALSVTTSLPNPIVRGLTDESIVIDRSHDEIDCLTCKYGHQKTTIYQYAHQHTNQAIPMYNCQGLRFNIRFRGREWTTMDLSGGFCRDSTITHMWKVNNQPELATDLLLECPTDRLEEMSVDSRSNKFEG